MTGNFIRLEAVSLTLPSPAGPVAVLRGVTHGFARGRSVAILGPSGSGKSSLMMVLAGLQRPSSGRVSIGETDITALNEDALAVFRRDHVGIVFQNFHLVPAMSALENAAIPLELAGRVDAFARAEEALVAVGLGHRLHHYPAQLSGGEQQRVALARATVARPALLLADEPTGNLDAATGTLVADQLFTLSREQGTTLLLITHDAALAARCDDVLHMRDGALS